MSKPLKQIKRQAAIDSGSNDIWMTSLYDRYLARPENEEFDTMCQASFASDFRNLSKTEGQNALSKKNPNVYELRNELGYIQRRTKESPAIVRFAKFSETNDPEKFYLLLLRMYMPHRHPADLKPQAFETYKDFYKTAGVKFKNSNEIKLVHAVVAQNRSKFEKLTDLVENAWEEMLARGPMEDAWAQIAPCAEQERILDDMAHVQDEVDPCEEDDIPELTNNGDNNLALNNLCSVELIGDSIRPMFKTMNEKQRQIFNFVHKWSTEIAQNKKPKPCIYIYIYIGYHTTPCLKCTSPFISSSQIIDEMLKWLKNSKNQASLILLLNTISSK